MENEISCKKFDKLQERKRWSVVTSRSDFAS